MDEHCVHYSRFGPRVCENLHSPNVYLKTQTLLVIPQSRCLNLNGRRRRLCPICAAYLSTEPVRLLRSGSSACDMGRFNGFSAVGAAAAADISVHPPAHLLRSVARLVGRTFFGVIVTLGSRRRRRRRGIYEVCC